ncbi:MAG: peptidoglycan recognition family protein [Hyphomicrobiaceae bacterium]
MLDVPGRAVVYWGRPDAPYSVYATRGMQKPRAVIVHYNVPSPVLSLVKYGHRSDPARGGASFGYHFYISQTGRIVQGAPLSRRTNHIKSTGNSARTDVGRHLWSGNTIGVSLVGACEPRSASGTGTYDCLREKPTPAQIAAGLAVIEALQARYQMACDAVFGHGELQTDRKPFEGAALTTAARGACLERSLEARPDLLGKRETGDAGRALPARETNTIRAGPPGRSG